MAMGRHGVRVGRTDMQDINTGSEANQTGQLNPAELPEELKKFEHRLSGLTKAPSSALGELMARPEDRSEVEVKNGTR
ncbi:MAG: hypothetical protein CMO26_22450 [Thiotrichales bacterium]|nr:hypothetical protein [Thiotrichales bacterium]